MDRECPIREWRVKDDITNLYQQLNVTSQCTPNNFEDMPKRSVA